MHASRILDRRAFLRGSAVGAAAIAVGGTTQDDRVTALSRDIKEIDVDAYRTSAEHREFADVLMAQAGVDKNDCELIRQVRGRWVFTVFDRNKYDKRFLRHGEIATYEVVL